MNTTSLSRPGHQARGSVTVLSTLYFRSDDDDVCPLLSADAANYNNYITAAFYFLPLIIRIINLHFTDHYPASTQFRGCNVSISEPWWWPSSLPPHSSPAAAAARPRQGEEQLQFCHGLAMIVMEATFRLLFLFTSFHLLSGHQSPYKMNFPLTMMMMTPSQSPINL